MPISTPISSRPTLNLSYLKAKHLVRRHQIAVSHLLRGVRPRHRYSVLERLARSGFPSVRQSVRERQILGQEPQLAQHGALVPGYVLVVETVAADVDDG